MIASAYRVCFYDSLKGSSMQQTFIGIVSVQGNRKMNESVVFLGCSHTEGRKSQIKK